MTLFINDYSEGCHERILEALIRTNRVQTTGYGTDPYCAEARDILRREMACPDADIWFLSGGTQTNLIALTAALRPHEAVIGAATCHIFVHETGAIEATGHKVLVIPDEEGKVRPEGVRAVLAEHSMAPHMVKPRVVYISQSTEVGTVYTKAELQALHEVCRENNLLLYADGARLGVALTAEGCDVTLDELVNYEGGETRLPFPPKGKHAFGMVKVGEKGQIVIPAKARKIFDIKPGDVLMVLGDEEQGIALLKEQDFMAMVQAMRHMET